MEKMPLILKAYGLSDIGTRRKKNEDAFLIDLKNKLFTLADGMGGHRAGEIASKNAVHIISKLFLEKKGSQSLLELSYLLHQAIQNANKSIYNLGKTQSNYRGMGTTFCSIFFFESKAIISHVGDSRVYLLRDEKLIQLTYDHSLVQNLIDTQHLEKDEPMISPYKNVITKALGPSKIVEPEIQRISVFPGDLFLLCSDGLSDYVSKRKLSKVLNETISLEEKTKKLINLAKQKKSQDNITIILVSVS